MILNTSTLAIAVLVILVILASAIAFLRWLLSTIYAKGNLYDSLLYEWMNKANIPNWQALQQKAGLSSVALWRLKDGETTNSNFGELSQIATVLSIPIAELLEKLASLKNLELEARCLECTQLKSQLQQVFQEKLALHSEGWRLHQELQQQRLGRVLKLCGSTSLVYRSCNDVNQISEKELFALPRLTKRS